MAIIQCIPTSCKAELLQAVHELDSDNLKIALYGESADIGPDTTEYTTTGEVVGTGYTAGGQELTNQTVMQSNGSAWVTWDNPSWPGASFYASGAMIYNATVDNKAIMILNFGTARLFTSTSNTVTFPASGSDTALMRLT
jgi:hypothetical protein